MASYDTLRRQCRTLESLLDSKFSSYSHLVPFHEADLEAGLASERGLDFENEIEEILEKLSETNIQLAATLEGHTGTPSSSLHAVQRHRELLQDYRRDFQRTKANIRHAIDQASLLRNVRDDIELYKTSATTTLLSEQDQINSSHRMIDDITNQAHEARTEFSQQRRTLVGITGRINDVINQMPGIDVIINKIRARRRRDALILGCVTGLGTLFVLNYLSR